MIKNDFYKKQDFPVRMSKYIRYKIQNEWGGINVARTLHGSYRYDY